MVKLHAGEYVALGKVESVLSRCSLVESVCVYADAGKTYVIALIVPRAKELAAVAKSLNLNPNDMEALCENPTIVNKVMEFIQTTAKTGKCTKPITIPRYFTSNSSCPIKRLFSSCRIASPRFPSWGCDI